MKINGLIISILLTISAVFLSWYLTRPGTSCSVYGAGRRDLNGYYSAQGGIYLKQGTKTTYNPDVFQIFELRKHFGTSYIGFSNQLWFIAESLRREAVYINKPEHPEDYLYRPPRAFWKAVKEESGSGPVVNHRSEERRVGKECV